MITLIFIIILNIPFTNIDYIEEDDNEMAVNNYTPLGFVSSKKPQNTHLWFETDAGGLYLVDSVDNTKIYYSSDKGETWTQIDIDPSNSSGDNKSRDHKIAVAYHRADNKRIHFVDCDNDGTADDFDYWTLDYNASESAPTSTEIGTSAGADANTVYVYDIWNGATGPFVINYEERSSVGTLVVWDVSGPIAELYSIAFSQPQSATFGTEQGAGRWWIVFSDNDDTDSHLILFRVGVGISNEETWVGYDVPSDENLRWMYFDEVNLFYFVMTKVADGKNYLTEYNFDDDTITVKGEYDISLMLIRDTSIYLTPKGFHISEYKVYRLHYDIAFQTLFISIISSDAVLIGITDSFLMNDDGDMFEYVDSSQYIFNFDIIMGYMRIPNAYMTAIDNFKISAGMLITLEDTFTTAGSTSTEIIFEGYVEPFNDQKLQKITLRSPANELKQIFPEGDYSGRSDEIINSLVGDYCKYVTIGVLSAGQAMGQVHYNGDESLFQILNNFALTDNFIWILTPTGQLYYNNGTVDSTINIAETDPISKVIKYKGQRAVNYVKIKGTIAGGDQVEGDGAENLSDINLNGYNPFIRTISQLNTNALCTITETSILTRWGTQATLVDFFHRDTSIGVIQAGETITFQNNKTDPNIGSGQFLIKLIEYKAKNQSVIYTISDRIV